MIRITTLALITLLIAFSTQAAIVSIDFEDQAVGAVLTNQYSAQGVLFNGATIYDPSSISNPPSGNGSNFVLPSSGYNTNGSFRITFIDPISLSSITTPYVTFTAYLGTTGEVFDSFDVYYDTGSGPSVGPIRYTFSSTQTFTVSNPAGIKSIAFKDWGVNAFDNFNFDLNVTTIPIPAAVWLFTSGLLGLIGLARRQA